jgi:MFS transporter, DHA2 family, multidrug resistance protein
VTDSAQARGASGWRPAHNPWLIAVVVTSAAFMEILDTTIVNVALPHIAGSLSVSYDQATWALTSYLVSNSIVLPISAFFGRLLGRKRYFVICIFAFTVCSFLCGIATNMGALIIFRILQGFFGGGLQPNQQSIVLDTFPPSQRGRAFSLTALATVVAPVLGPTVGGWITDSYSWRWVFFINVPIGILATFAVMNLVEDPPWAKKGQKVSIDYIGIGLIALTFAAFQIMLDRGEDADWFGSAFIRAFAALAAVGAAAACGWLLYTRNPVVDLRVLKDRNFALGCVAISFFSVVLYGSAVLIPVIGVMMPHVQTRYLITAGFLVLGCALLYSRHIAPDIDFFHLMTLRIAQAAGIGFLFVPVSVLTYCTIPERLQGDATALFTMFRNVAGSVGISVSTAAITARTQVHTAYLAANLSHADPTFRETLSRVSAAVKNLGTAAGDATQVAMGQIERTLIAQAGLLAYMDVFLYCAILAFLFVPFTFFFSSVKATRKAGPE